MKVEKLTERRVILLGILEARPDRSASFLMALLSVAPTEQVFIPKPYRRTTLKDYAANKLCRQCEGTEPPRVIAQFLSIRKSYCCALFSLLAACKLLQCQPSVRITLGFKWSVGEATVMGTIIK